MSDISFNLGNLDVIPVTFRSNETNESISIELSSHYTCISNDSGSGKTSFIQTLLRSATTNEISIECEYPVRVTDIHSIDVFLTVKERLILIIDEATVLNSKYALIKKLNKSHHVFICVSRSLPGEMPCAYQSLYSLYLTKTGFYGVNLINPIPITNTIHGTVLVESSPDRSENAFLCDIIDTIPVSGKNNFIKFVEDDKEYTLFADLGGISNSYRFLLGSNARLYYYNYQAFEQLLFDSPFLGYKKKSSNFDYLSNEKFYEAGINTIDNYLHTAVSHGKRLPDKLLGANRLKILESQVGQGILQKANEDSCVSSDVRGVSAF